MKRLLSVLLTIILAVTLFGCSAKEETTTTSTTTTTTTTTTTQAPAPVNPLTGEDNFRKGAVGKRPVAIVVENTPPARPQWAIGTSDIIVEGEVEGGISRMLWIYADYKAVPEKVGPLRSARPSYVKFSKLFDSIFVHWGGSHSKSGYVGGYETIRKEKVDDIDGMNGGELFGRDKTRRVSSEHRGIMNGKKLADKIKSKGYRRKLDENATSLSFNEEIKNAGADEAKSVNVKFSSRTDTRKFTFSDKDKLYHTSDWRDDISFENIIVIMDTTKYITVPYKGSSTTYLNYTLKSGSGYYFSNGTKTKIKWSAENGRLEFKDENLNELLLNKGKTYIALASSNNGGKVTYP